MLNVLEIYAREGGRPSVWTAAHFRDAARETSKSRLFKASASRTGLTVELPFPNLTSRVELTTDAEHPQMGRGLLMLLTARTSLSHGVMRELVLDCNQAELKSLFRSHSVGSWCIGDESLAHSTFIPNLSNFASVAFLNNMVWSMVQRAYWIAENL